MRFDFKGIWKNKETGELIEFTYADDKPSDDYIYYDELLVKNMQKEAFGVNIIEYPLGKIKSSRTFGCNRLFTIISNNEFIVDGKVFVRSVDKLGVLNRYTRDNGKFEFV